MKKLSKTLKELNISFAFPIEIKDANGNETYVEHSNGDWWKSEYDANGNQTYFEKSNGDWWKREYDANGNETYYEHSNGDWWKSEYDANGNLTYYEDSNGRKSGTPRIAKPCAGKVVEIDGIKYELKAL